MPDNISANGRNFLARDGVKERRMEMMKAPDDISANGRNLMGGGDFLGHLIKGDALGACNGTFVRIVRPGREDEEATRSDGIEKEVGGFEVIAEAVVGEIDDIAIVMKERVEHFLFIARDERRDHDCAFGGGIETACFVVFEGLVVAMFSGIFDPHATDVDGLAELLHEDTDITYGIVGATVDLDVVLDAEEAGFEALSSEAGGVHLDIANHRLELAASGHGAEEGFLREDDILLPDSISGNGRNLIRNGRNLGVPDSISGNERNLIRNGRNLLLIPNTISGNGRNLVGGRVEGEFFDALPEATDDSEDALRHGGCDVENGVQVVRHEAVLEQFDLGVAFGDLGEVAYDGFAEFGALHVGLHGVIVGDDEFAQQGFAGRYHKDHVVDADAAPSAAVLLPMPSVVCHVRQILAQSYIKNLRYASFRGKFF